MVPAAEVTCKLLVQQALFGEHSGVFEKPPIVAKEHPQSLRKGEDKLTVGQIKDHFRLLPTP